MGEAVRSSLRRQRGFIYLTSGANGTGKTLITLKEVREKQLAENRPVYFRGFKPKAPLLEFGWKAFNGEDWQELPDGSIIVMDECQEVFPPRGTSAKVPDYVQMMSQHRSRGFDFYMLTQHPGNVDKFVTRLIDNPGWHRHFKRVFGQDLVSSLLFGPVNNQCEKAGSGKSATVSMLPFPKEVYDWYESASLHTGKKKIPRAVWVVLAGVLGVPLLGYFAWQSVAGMGSSRAAKLAPAGAPGVEQAATSVERPQGGYRSSSATVLSTEDYLASYAPRIPGFPHTAPRFDAVTTPVHAPYPAACVDRVKSGCTCYTQQATRLQVPEEVCQQVVQNGFFVEWEQHVPKSEYPARGPGEPTSPIDARDASAVGRPMRPAGTGGARDGAVIASMRAGRL